MAINDQLERLMESARMRLPGAVDAVLKHELFAVLDEFFQDSNAWVEEKTFKVDPDKHEYRLFFPVGTPVRLMNIVNSNGTRVAATMPVPGVLQLVSPPAEDDEYTASVSMTVVDPITRGGDPQCPAWFLKKHYAGLLDGLLARMMSQPAKPYTSERYSIYHMRRFRNAIAKARVEAMHSNVYRGQNWSFPQSFAVRRQ